MATKVGTLIDKNGDTIYPVTTMSQVAGVYEEIHPATQSSIPSGGMLPNVFYNLGTITTAKTMSLASPISGIYNEYQFQFSIGSTVPTIT